MNQALKRGGRGRPPGSKNKRKALSADLIAKQCDEARHNPIAWLIGVGNGTNHDYAWNKDDRFKANAKLADLIHGEKRLMVEDKSQEATQYEIVFLENETDFQLQGAPGTEGTAPVHGQPAVQRAGVSSQDGQDGIRHQQADP
jgi:hypothetical protein